MAKAASFQGETIFQLRPLDLCSPISCGPVLKVFLEEDPPPLFQMVANA